MRSTALVECAIAAAGCAKELPASSDGQDRAAAHRVSAIGPPDEKTVGGVGAGGMNEGAGAEIADVRAIGGIERPAGEGHGAAAAGLPAHGDKTSRVVPTALGEVADPGISD